MTKKIIIETLGTHQVGGGRTSIRTLLEHIFRLEQNTLFLVLLNQPEPLWAGYPNVQQRVLRAANRFYARVRLQCELPILARKEQADLVHFTKNLGTFGLACPYIVTVHDLTTLHLSSQHGLLDVLYWKLIEPITIRRAAHVVAVSYDTAQDVQKFYSIPEKKIDVVYWAPHRRFQPMSDHIQLNNFRQRYQLPDQYILFVGILARKKNLPTLLRAFALLRAQRPNAPDLVIVGRRYSQSEEKDLPKLIHHLGLNSSVRLVGSIPDEDLPLFYNASRLFVLPSLHEGFGIPCLEAMACGIPVITTNRGALPEIVGDAALILSDPMDANDLKDAIECLLYDENLRQEMILRGLRRASAFSWEKSAQKMIAIYHRVLEDSHASC